MHCKIGKRNVPCLIRARGDYGPSVPLGLGLFRLIRGFAVSTSHRCVQMIYGASLTYYVHWQGMDERFVVLQQIADEHFHFLIPSKIPFTDYLSLGK